MTQTTLMIHLALIVFIVLSSYQVYAAFYQGLAKKVWGWRLIPGMPNDLNSFTKAFRVLSIAQLLLMILLYVLYIL